MNIKNIVPILSEVSKPNHFDTSNLSVLPRHDKLEKIVDLLVDHSGNNDRHFMRVFALSYLGPVAAAMRCTIQEPRNTIPVNIYTIAMADSGAGKGTSMVFMENFLLPGFRERFSKETYPQTAETALWQRAVQASAYSGESDEEEYEKYRSMWMRQGAHRFVTRGITTAAIQQMRNKAILANAGCINLQVDEIGRNLTSVSAEMTVFLELYDMGLMKESTIKNTSENNRDEELEGWAAACCLFFGTPSALLDGGRTEAEFRELLETGYARRSLFAWGDKKRNLERTADEILDEINSKHRSASIDDLRDHFANLASPANMNWHIETPKEVQLAYINYQLDCQKRAAGIPSDYSIVTSEVENRWFKALKVAGVLTFLDHESTCSMDHLGAAIRIVEEQQEAFLKIMFQDKPHVRLARHLADTTEPLTHAEIAELPYMRNCTSNLRREEELKLAIAWGYKNNILIKRQFVESIEMFDGEKLQDTNLDKLILSYSNDLAQDYEPMDAVPFDCLSDLMTSDGLHWCNHRYVDGHRTRSNVIPGFNMLVLDCDGEVTLNTVHKIFKDHAFMTYTTKRHDPDGEHRFRLILPTNHTLYLDTDDYQDFMQGVLEWMPFWSKETSDGGPKQPEKKWLTHEGADVHYNEGRLFDVLPFIPKTTRNKEYREANEPLRNLSNLERYYVRQIIEGKATRNNTLAAYVLALVDNGHSLTDIETQVKHLNSQFPNPLGHPELHQSVLKTAAVRVTERDKLSA